MSNKGLTILQLDLFYCNTVDIIITKHAYERARKRMSWTADAFKRMSEKAWTNGLEHKNTKGQLKHYVDDLWTKYETANSMRIYGENVYFFRSIGPDLCVLITVYKIPTCLTKYLKL